MTEIVEKPWGYERVVLNSNTHFKIKELSINKGYRSSLHYHKEKFEVFIVMKGQVKIRRGDKIHHLKEGDVLEVFAHTIHQIEAVTNVKIYEVANVLFGDVFRVQDDYERGDEE